MLWPRLCVLISFLVLAKTPGNQAKLLSECLRAVDIVPDVIDTPPLVYLRVQFLNVRNKSQDIY